ncbi:LOW QUALITY PROTEIN: von Willebrand factor A domain-containing protein 8-like [Dendronephthya gigantea]|uniref:LOW QUALITY PROTEIN: von Willebrand factor A domain-containing protein 8-like n=1 Tax=Dendronephthya gigantea TaxID=151771 RepID=UPI00106D0E5B|nr:LOW QUALITY PROTEIN: von Willebrand factor A domain-containing protein 8-like [Dendronephthya gigantea]
MNRYIDILYRSPGVAGSTFWKVNINIWRRERFGQTSRSYSDEFVRIGNVRVPLKTPKHVEKVPINYSCPAFSNVSAESILQHLKWIMKKDQLGQDIFLIGPPGSLRRSLAMQYAELTQREIEYVSLSRDTTESDLKQRREISCGSSHYVNQSSVRAALEGRVLILDGIEKAERNVLPVLNNLLENREMQLDDGRFLVSAARYDSLIKEHSKEELDSWKLLRVNEGFRVFALGVPVPRYPGNPLDPPLRSRFQSRDVPELSYKEQLQSLVESWNSDVPKEKLANLVSFAHTIQSSELLSLGMPDFPIENLKFVVQIMNDLPFVSNQHLINRLYPHQLIMGKEGQTAITDTLKTFHLDDAPVSRNEPYHLKSVTRFPNHKAMIALEGKSKTINKLEVLCGAEGSFGSQPLEEKEFVMTHYHSKILADMFQSHLVKDFCLIGPKGCGKSVLLHQFSRLLGYQIEPVVLHQDMTSRDLLQQRTTLQNGDTIWRPSPLVVAATEGHLAVLDGIHRTNPGTLAVLQRLVGDREISLYDGSQLLRSDRYELLKKNSGLSDDQLTEKNVYRIHPSFRIIALAEPPSINSSQNQWLNSELLHLFLYHHLEPLNKTEEAEVVFKMVPRVAKDKMKIVLDMADQLRNSNNSMLLSIAPSFSTRQLLRVARRIAEYPHEDLYQTINRACLADFLPSLARTALEDAMKGIGISKKITRVQRKFDVNADSADGYIQIGETQHEIYEAPDKTKVPETLFYSNSQHLEVMENMLKDFRLGEHLLLVGNQGVGKNKIVDKFLQLLNRPREYIQLHRDTTVQTLTLQPTVQDGVIVYEDSPLVQALKFGHVLVIDEADKAPINVTCVLKTLVESGEMILGDGRRVLPAGYLHHPPPDDVIEIHPDFRVIVLANRPGFPFLGNDFFGAMGDIFSCHAINNPDKESEMELLKQYGPDVAHSVLAMLVNAFSELRQMADLGEIAYPYSTRELVNIVKHLQVYPEDGLGQVVRNVFDFDSYHPDAQKTVLSTLRKHGIPVGVTVKDVKLSKEFPLPSPSLVHNWSFVDGKDTACSVREQALVLKKTVKIDCPKFDIDRYNARSTGFTELLSEWMLPFYESSILSDITVSEGGAGGDWLHLATTSPLVIYSMKTNQNFVVCTDLYSLFPYNYFNQSPQIKIAALSGDLYEGQVIFHEQRSNTMLLLNPSENEFQQVDLPADSLVGTISKQLKQTKYKMSKEKVLGNIVAVYSDHGKEIQLVDFDSARVHTISLPFIIDQLHLVSEKMWIVREKDVNTMYILSPEQGVQIPNLLTAITTEDHPEGIQFVIDKVSAGALPQDVLESCQNYLPNTFMHDFSSRTVRLVASEDNLASLAVSNPVKIRERYPLSFYSYPRKEKGERGDVSEENLKDLYPNPLCLPKLGQVVRVIPSSFVPSKSTNEETKNMKWSNSLEVVDISQNSVRYLSLPRAKNSNPYTKLKSPEALIDSLSNDVIVSVSRDGCVRLWETGTSDLQKSFSEWKTLVGNSNDSGSLQVTRERSSGLDVTQPKHGKVDPNNEPHVGGNTWAGGTGGRDTAGLGGKGGPYRLDAGHDVFQISDEEKDAVPEEVKRAAREMGERAFKERLKQIEMSEHEAEVYEKFSSRVHHQVQSLRVLLESLQAKGKERQWIRHQSSGDLDDAKLIEGLTGEKTIYKKRADQEPEPGSVQQLPKQLRLVLDVSGSMYRFNGLDGRLERVMEAACLVMEAFDKYERRFKFDIVGHSGENPEIMFVSQDSPPVNNKKRLQVLQTMHAHAQFCMTGDHTLEASKKAIESVVQREADEYFVIIFSDANLRRYGIPPSALAKTLTSNPRVNSFIIFIGSLGNEAERLSKELPAGRSFVCMDTKNIPEILQQIFSTALISS